MAELDAKVRERAREYYGETGVYSPTGGIRIILCPCGRRTGAVAGRWMRCPCGTESIAT